MTEEGGLHDRLKLSSIASKHSDIFEVGWTHQISENTLPKGVTLSPFEPLCSTMNFKYHIIIDGFSSNYERYL